MLRRHQGRYAGRCQNLPSRRLRAAGQVLEMAIVGAPLAPDGLQPGDPVTGGRHPAPPRVEPQSNNASMSFCDA